MPHVTINWTSMNVPHRRDINEDEFDKILSMAISALGRLEDRSPMEERALSVALRLEAR